MALYKVPFYENAVQQGYRSGTEWLAIYDDGCRRLMDTLVAKGVREHLYYQTINCLGKFREYLEENKLQYSQDVAVQWLETTKPFSQGCATALYRLNDILEFGEILPEHAVVTLKKSHYSQLLEPWKSILDNYLFSNDMIPSTMMKARDRSAAFFHWLQSAGINQPQMITYNLLIDYLESVKTTAKSAFLYYVNAVENILQFMGSNGLCSLVLSYFPHFYMQGKILRMQQLTVKEVEIVTSLREKSKEFPVREYVKLISDFMEELKLIGYSRTMIRVAHFTLYNLLLFLEMLDLGYHPEIAKIWLEHNKDIKSWGAYRRMLNLFELYTKDGNIHPDIIFTYKPLLCDSLPLWCREKLDFFLLLKEKEGWEPSTLCMYRSSVTRFCLFVVDQGIESFSDITPMLIKKFNLQDLHMTSEGKNAYNVKIRSFLRYLERQEIVPYGISEALCCTAEVRTKIVKTLSAEEKAAIDQKGRKANTALELRDRAIVLLAWKMGLRAIDIVHLKLTDINWDNQMIRFIQQKTQREISLPMPVEVGNSIYLYLKNGRPNSDLPFVFLKAKFPYNAVSKDVCKNALRRLLSDLDHSTSEFKTLRKTFATNCLQSNVSPNLIADMLGHEGLTSVEHYLNLDTDRMALCPLSLAEMNLGLDEESRYD